MGPRLTFCAIFESFPLKVYKLFHRPTNQLNPTQPNTLFSRFSLFPNFTCQFFLNYYFLFISPKLFVSLRSALNSSLFFHFVHDCMELKTIFSFWTLQSFWNRKVVWIYWTCSFFLPLNFLHVRRLIKVISTKTREGKESQASIKTFGFSTN